MQMTAADIMKLCAEVRRFSKVADLRWKGLPVIEWTFATISDFATTRSEILRAISPMMLFADEKSRGRVLSTEVMEIDCHGVTFRLRCEERRMTKAGPYGAADV